MDVENQFTIHVSSLATPPNSDNIASKFTASLPQVLNFEGGKWAMALTQIIFSRKIDILPTFDFTLEIENLETNANIVTEFPRNINDSQDLIILFKNQMQQNGIDIEELETGNVCLKFNSKMKLTLGRHLCFLLGFPHKTSRLIISNDDVKQDEVDEDDAMIIKTKNNVFLFEHPPRKSLSLRPSSLFVYAKELSYSIMATQKCPLLSIVNIPYSVSQSQMGNYDVQIENATFIDISNTQLKSLSFYICSHDNSLIQFPTDAVTYLGLTFQKRF